MEDFELLTDAEIAARKQPRSATALDESDLAGLDAEVSARDNALKASLRQGVIANPDDAARTKALSQFTGISPDVVERNKEDVSAQARVATLQNVLASSPILARQMSDPEFARLAHDDAENLSLFERTLRTYLGASVKAGIENLLGASAKVADTALQMIGPGTSEQDVATIFKDKPAELKEFAEESPTMFLSRFARAMQQASEATMQNLSPAAKAEYGDLKYATLNPDKAAYLSPIKVAGDAIQSLPTTLALAVSAYLTKGVANRVEAEALAAGMSEELARKAAIHAAAETMAKLGASTEGAAGFGQQAIQTREQATKITDATLATSPEYQRLITSGYSPEAARLALSALAADVAGATGGAADAITNYFGGKFLGRIIGEGGALLKRMAKGFGTEATTEAVQSGLEQLGQNEAVKQFLDPQQELLDGVAEQIAQGFVVGGVMGGSFTAATGRRSQAEIAQRDAETLKRLFELAASDKLRERSPEEFAKFVQAAAEEHGSSAVYVDAATFAQAAQEKGLDVAATMPETAAQIEEAIATRGDLRIPLGELTAALPGTGLENTLLQHMRMSPEAPTLKETQDKQFVEDTKAAVEKAMAEHEFDTAQKASGRVVERELLTQLTKANRFTKDVNETYARLMASFYTVQAARLGTTAEEMYVKYPLHIRAESVTGERVMDQARKFTPEFTKWFSGSKVVDEKGLPRVVYHGTQASFDQFSQDEPRSVSSEDQGYFFIDDPKAASAHAMFNWGRDNPAPNVMPVYLRIQNPMVVGNIGEPSMWYDLHGPKLVKKAMVEGHDGLVIGNDERKLYVAFKASQIKSAIGNSGAFDASDPNILMQDTIDNATGRVDDAPPFVSTLAMQVASAKMNVAPAAQWKTFINSLASKGVKKDEITLSGVMDWLDAVEKGEPATPAERDAAKYNAIRDANKSEESGTPVIRVNGDTLAEMFPMENEMVLVHLANAMLEGRRTQAQIDARGADAVNFSQAHAALIRGERSSEVERDRAARLLTRLRDADVTISFENGAAKPGTAVATTEPQRPEVQKNPRIPKQAVIDYLAQNGVKVKTTILGAPKEEQEDFVGQKPTNAPVLAVDPNTLPQGFGVEPLRDTQNVVLLSPDGARREVVPSEAAILAQEYVEARRKLPTLPDDYEYEILDDGTYEISVPRHQGRPLSADTREEAMDAINEHYDNYREDAGPSEPDEEAIDDRAKELVKEDSTEIAREYANNSEYANYAFDVAFRPPTYKIVRVEGDKGIVDMFTGRETPEHYRVVELTFENGMPKDDAVTDTDRGNSLANENMPVSEDDFLEMFEPDEEKPVGPEFKTGDEARQWATQNVSNARETPIWILWDRESYGSRHDPENGSNEGEFESFQEASTGADSLRESRYEAEVDQMKEDIENDPENYVDLSRYRDRAEDELRREMENDRPEPWYSRDDMERFPRGWSSVPSHGRKEDDKLALQHRGQYQSDGGTNYRELVIGVPDVEAYNATDRTHFGHVFGGRTIAWARVKEHEAPGGHVLFVEEIQSQRAQAGRKVRENEVKRLAAREGISEKEAAKRVPKDFGFDNETAREQARADYARYDEEVGDLRRAFYERLHTLGFNDMDHFSRALQDGSAEARAAEPEVNAFEERERDLMGLRGAANNRDRAASDAVPSAPFTNDSQSWTALTMKRLIRYAVDRGLKHVVWTPGLEQVERYEGALRRQVDRIDWKKVAGGIEVDAQWDRESKRVAKFAADHLEDAIGPSMAQRIINDPNQEGVIEGENIKIDDRWPAGYYGDEHGLNDMGEPSVMTIVANKILKSLGGDEVKTFKISLTEEDKTYGAAPGFDITDKMREAALKGLPLFQRTEGQNARGQIAFGDDIKDQPSIITLLQNADLSTFLHESGHFYLEVLTDMATQPNAPAEIMGDMQHILNWFGVPDLATWQAMTLDEKRPFHEQFARGFESYLFSGKAPNTELSGLFSRFRAWLINVYKQITALNVTLTPEVQGVFDRMLATNDEIIEAEAARAYAPLFKSAAEMGATAEEWRDYQELGLAATQEAVDMLQTRSLRDMKWLSNAKSRLLKKLQREAAGKRKAIEREVTEAVRSQPVYAAIRFLTHGELAEEDRTNKERKALESIAGQPSKFSIPDLIAMYGDGPAAPWRYLNTGKFGHLTAADGLNPNMVAELFGFTSGDHLVREILAAEPEDSVIQGMTDTRMLERYGDMASPEAIEKAANEALHNEARGRFIATEVQALSKAAGQRKVLIPAAKEFAATLVARKKVRDIRPAQYITAETRAAKAAERAKSLVEKATEKRNQLVNHYAARAALDALTEVEKALAYLRRVGDSKTIDVSYREQIQALLARFELRQVTNKDVARRESLLQWIDDQRAQGMEPVIDADLVNEAVRKPYREMTLEEFRGLTDAVRNIEHLGRLKHRLLTLQDEREFAAVVGEAADSIEQHAKRTLREPLERTKWVKIKSGVAEFFAMHRKFALMLREMDGHADNGVLWRLLGRPMNAAGDAESVMREAATKKLQALLAPVLKEGRMGEKRYIPEIKASLSREGRIMVALNMGNAGNLQRLLDGDNWTLDQAQAILHTLTKTEMNFVQAIWNYVGSFRDEIGAQQRRITGVAPEWVEPRPIQTVHGEYAGGYIPAKYDTSRSTRSLSDEAAAGIMDMWRAKRGAAKTRDSFTKARASKVVDRPLRKDFGVITQHVTEVTHRLAWQEYLIDAQRILRAGKVDNAIRSHYGPEVLKVMRDAIEDIAAGEVAAQNAFESGVNYIRTGATIAGLGWRLTAAMLQPFGLTQSMVRIGTRHVAAGLVEWLGDAVKMENTAARIFEKSAMMRLRSKTMQREISEIRNVVAGKNSAIEASYFYLITKLQLVADIPTWLGQYHKSVELGADEKSAVAQADQAVLDAQSGGQIKDLAAIQRGGPMLKLFTNFYSFFNTTYNLTGDAVGRTKWRNPLSVGRLAVDLLLLYSVPAALGTALKAALHSGDDGEDEKKLIRQLIADQLTYLFGTMVGLREIAGALQTAAGLPGDYQGPASVRVFAELAKLGKQANQGEVDEALLKAANNVAGILFHYPAGQIGATLDGIVTMADGKTTNPGALVVGSNKK